MRIVILSSETIHHTYFINYLMSKGIEVDRVIYETAGVKPKFDTKLSFMDELEAFENEHFFTNLSDKVEGIPIHEVENINNDQSVELIKNAQFDVGVVFGTRKILPHIIDLFPNELLNVHRGMVAHYRGLDSDYWCAYHGDYENIGVTIHKVDKDLDTGDVAYQEAIEMQQGMRVAHLRYHTSVLAADLMFKTLDRIDKGEMTFEKQTSFGRYYSFFPSIFESYLNKFNRDNE